MRWSLLLLVACSYAPKPGETPITGDDAPVDTCAGSGIEACNGLDDDCDGDTDEGFSVGMPCDGDDSDQCSDGVLTCEGTCIETVEAKVEICNGAVDEDCNQLTDCGDSACEDTPFCCVDRPDGLAHTIGNTCVTDDFGSSGSSDNLEVYCCGGQARFCLSKEACPWRAGCPAGNTKTCSRAGLGASLKMAVADCQLWKGQTDYGCSLDEQITFP